VRGEVLGGIQGREHITQLGGVTKWKESSSIFIIHGTGGELSRVSASPTATLIRTPCLILGTEEYYSFSVDRMKFNVGVQSRRGFTGL
jgi:hypothetical protein